MRCFLAIFFAVVAVASAVEGAHADQFFNNLLQGEVQHYEGLGEHNLASHVDRLLEKVSEVAQRSYDERQMMRAPTNHCQCVKDTCGCCQKLDVPALKINATACVNFTYIPKTKGMNVVMTYNNKTLLNETVSLRNPPPLCAGLPYVATWCTIFYNVTWSPAVGACLRYELRLFSITILKIPIGCYTFPSREGDTIRYVRPPSSQAAGKRLSLAQILRKQSAEKEKILHSHREML